MRDRNYYAAMMVEVGDADALVSGLTKDYPKTILPSLQIIGTAEGVDRVAGYVHYHQQTREHYFFADTTVNVDPNAEELAGHYRTHCPWRKVLRYGTSRSHAFVLELRLCQR